MGTNLLKVGIWVLLALNIMQAGFLIYKYTHRGPSNPIFPELIYSKGNRIDNQNLVLTIEN